MLITLLLLLSPPHLAAEVVSLPEIAPPAGIVEGIEVKLSEEDVARLRPWAKNSKSLLEGLVESIEGFGNAKSIEWLTSGIRDVVEWSHPKHPELLMRYVLNRGLLVDEKLAREMDSNVPGVLRIRKNFLLSSIHLALGHYKSDLSFLDDKAPLALSQIDFARFGLDYARFLQEFSHQLFDVSAQYQVARLGLGLLHWDLYRDLKNKKYAPTITKVHQRLKIWPELTPAEEDALVFIRQMRKLMGTVLPDIEPNEPNRYAPPKNTSKKNSLERVMSSKEIANALAKCEDFEFAVPRITCNLYIYKINSMIIIPCTSRLTNYDSSHQICQKYLNKNIDYRSMMDKLKELNNTIRLCKRLGNSDNRTLCMKQLSKEIGD